jgi:predicted AAA+ superfamily ATPase
MATRKPTPDILGDLLGEPSTTQHTGRTMNQSTSIPENQNTHVPGDHTVERVKATFYLHPEVLERLEDSWHRLRKLAKGPERGKVSKSLIVEVALELALQDLEGQGEASPLARKMGHP